MDAARTKFVVGLGNPERKYVGTRHNVGFAVLDALIGQGQFSGGKSRFHSLCWSGTLRGCPVVLAAPQTYMNRSGLAVAELMAFYKAEPSDLLVVQDDLALPLGRLRARSSGSAGGHNGMADILAALGRMDVGRLRVGIGSPGPQMDQVAYVLGRFAPDEEPVMQEAIVRAARAAGDWVEKGITYIMDRYNQDANDVGNSKGNGNER